MPRVTSLRRKSLNGFLDLSEIGKVIIINCKKIIKENNTVFIVPYAIF